MRSKRRAWVSSRSTGVRPRLLLEPEKGRRGEVALQHRLNLCQRVLVLFGRVRDDAIGGCEDPQLTHIRIIGRKEDADVAGDPGQYDPADAKRREKRIERRVEEPRMLRLQDEIIAGRWPETA